MKKGYVLVLNEELSLPATIVLFMVRTCLPGDYSASDSVGCDAGLERERAGGAITAAAPQEIAHQ